MRRSLSILFALAVGLAACADDGAETTTSAAVAPTNTESAPSGALLPEVCLGNAGVFFGFHNQSSVPVVVPEGPLNRLDGGVAGDNPMRTTLFAVGRTPTAFWVVPEGVDTESVEPVVWTITGPDGVERSATADESTARCDDAATEPNSSDPRLAELEVSDASVAADGSTVTLTATVVGVPELSVCNLAFTAEPVGITLDASVLPTTNEPSGSFTLPLRPATTRPGQLGDVTVVANVVDRCSYDGLTVSTWPVTQPFITLGYGVTVCAWVDESGVLSIEITPGLCELGVTGGIRNRPG